MNKAISARIQGDDYQGLFFWLYAVKLFHPHTSVSKVVYEAENVKSFDDVVVHYRKDKPLLDCRHNEIYMDCFQVKFHVTQNGAFSWEGLKDPSFINATSFSIMQRLLNAYRKYFNGKNNVRFHLVAPWQIHPDDVLAKLHSNDEGEIRLDKLFDDNKQPGTKKIRKAMAKHLKIEDDELYNVFATLRIWKDFYTFQRLIDELNKEFLFLGFKQIDCSSCLNPYLELIKQWSIRGITEFTKDFIFTECKREGLFTGKNIVDDDYIDVGIRSFYRRAESMQDETEKMLCLLDKYEGRHLKENLTWLSDINTEIERFISEEIVRSKRYRMHLDTHLSNAFLAGYYLDTKSGVEVYPLQKTQKGRILWLPEKDDSKDYPDWHISSEDLTDDKLDVALVLGVTHDIYDDVKYFISREKLNVSRIINCQITGRQSGNSVIDGYHAKILADSISKIVKKRSIEEKQKNLHIFSASPVALMFFLGQLSRSFGKIVLYEYDFEWLENNSYFPSFKLPVIRKEN